MTRTPLANGRKDALRSAVTTLTLPIISALETYRGPEILHLPTFFQTKNRILAYRGYGCCRQGSQALIYGLEQMGFSNLQIAGNSLGNKRHQFLYDLESEVIIDTAYKQLFSPQTIQLSLLYLSQSSKDRDFLEELDSYIKNPPTLDKNQLDLYEESLSKESPIFCDSEEELRLKTQKFLERFVYTKNLSPKIGEILLNETLENWGRSDLKPWRTVPKTLHTEMIKFDTDPQDLSISPATKKLLVELRKQLVDLHDNPSTKVAFPETEPKNNRPKSR